MSLFTPGYLKEGPGIDEDAPKKEGLPLFFEILVREFWQLLKVNILFVICSLPLITVGPARAAMAKCTLHMVQDVPNDVWYDFRHYLCKNWRRTGAIGLVELFVVGLELALTPLAETSLTTEVLLLLIEFATIVYFGYLWPMEVGVQLSTGALLKNALILPLTSVQHSLPALFCVLVIFWLHKSLFPFSIPAFLFVPFGLSSFIMSFAAWSDIKRLVISK